MGVALARVDGGVAQEALYALQIGGAFQDGTARVVTCAVDAATTLNACCISGFARLRTHSQKSTVAARAMAERKTFGHRS